MMRPSRSPLLATQQVQISSLIQKRIITDTHARNSGNRIEDDLALFLVVVVRHLLQGNRPQLHQLPVLGPMLRCIIGDIAFLGDLCPPAETHPTVDDPRLDFVVQICRILGFGFFVGDVRFAGVRCDAVSYQGLLALGGDEFESVDAEEFLGSEAGGEWLGRRDKGQRRGCFAQECFDGRWVLGRVRSGRCAYCLQQVQEAGAGIDWEEGRRVGDNVGVLSPAALFWEIESYGESFGVGIGVVVWYCGNSSRV